MLLPIAATTRGLFSHRQQTLYTGFTYVTKEKVVDLGSVEITKDIGHTEAWQPYIGIGVMVIGGGVLQLGRKTSPAH